MSVQLSRTEKRRVSDFRRLNKPFDAALVPEVRTAQLRALYVQCGGRLRG